MKLLLIKFIDDCTEMTCSIDQPMTFDSDMAYYLPFKFKLS